MSIVALLDYLDDPACAPQAPLIIADWYEEDGRLALAQAWRLLHHSGRAPRLYQDDLPYFTWRHGCACLLADILARNACPCGLHNLPQYTNVVGPQALAALQKHSMVLDRTLPGHFAFYHTRKQALVALVELILRTPLTFSE